MAILPIMNYPRDSVLRIKAQTVGNVDGEILEFLNDMADTMYFSNGVGLAAPQVGLSKRLIIVDGGIGIIKLINPVILEATGVQVELEGCLSIPGISGMVKRPEKVIVQALNEHGQLIEVTGTGLTARAFCHEIDHLEGMLFIDKVIPKEMLRMIASGGENK